MVTGFLSSLSSSPDQSFWVSPPQNAACLHFPISGSVCRMTQLEADEFLEWSLLGNINTPLSQSSYSFSSQQLPPTCGPCSSVLGAFLKILLLPHPATWDSVGKEELIEAAMAFLPSK